MFVNFFKTNHPFPLVAVLPFLGLLLWLPGIIKYPLPLLYEHTMPLYDAIASLCSRLPYSAPILAYIMVYIQALILNNIINKQDILKPKSNLPALLFVVFMSSLIELQTLHPIVLSNLFVLFVLDRICTIYNQKTVFSQAFDAGMLIAFASFFYFPTIILFLFVWGTFLIIRPFVWREYIIALLGLLLPYLFLATWYFWTGEWYTFFESKITDLDPSEIALPHLDASDYVLVTFLFILLILSVMSIFKIMGNNVVRVQYLLKSLIVLMVAGALALLIDSSRKLYTIAFVAIPSSVFMANYFLVYKKRILSEVFFLLLIFLIIFNLVKGF